MLAEKMHHRLRLPTCSSFFSSGVRCHINNVFDRTTGLSQLLRTNGAINTLPGCKGLQKGDLVEVADMGGGQSPQQRACFSTNASSSTVVESEPNLAEPQREYYVPVRRQYEGAPKRQHGRNHGWRKFSKPKDRPWHVKAEKGVEKRELKEVSATIKGIRVSPWQLNLLARVVRNLPVVDAIAQMEFGKKKHTNTYQKIIKNACNLAHIRYGLIPDQLEVAEVSVTKGVFQKRLVIMGRGRVGVGSRKWSHLNMTLKEIDFDQEISNAKTKTGMRKATARKEAVAEQVRKARMEETGEEEPTPVEAEFADKK